MYKILSQLYFTSFELPDISSRKQLLQKLDNCLSIVSRTPVKEPSELIR